MVGILERPGRKPRGQKLGFVEVSLAEKCVELEQQSVDELVVVLGKIDGLVAHLHRFGEVTEWVNVDLGGVQHGLEVGVVEGDRLAIAFDRVLEVALQRGDIAQEVVGLG